MAGTIATWPLAHHMHAANNRLVFVRSGARTNRAHYARTGTNGAAVDFQSDNSHQQFNTPASPIMPSPDMPIRYPVSASDLLPFTGPVESGASGVPKLDSSSGRHYLIGR